MDSINSYSSAILKIIEALGGPVTFRKEKNMFELSSVGP